MTEDQSLHNIADWLEQQSLGGSARVVRSAAEEAAELRYEAGMYNSLYDLAKARIETLEAALREIASYWGEAPVDNSAWNIWAFKVQEIARAALDG